MNFNIYRQTLDILNRPRLFLSMVCVLCVSLLLCVQSVPSANAAVLTVNSTADPGDGICDSTECTLREAINIANATPGSDSINFNLPGTAPYTIQPTSALPTITDLLIIDATTQPGFMYPSVIEIDGSLAGANANGLSISAGDSTVKALMINRFSGDGIYLSGKGGNYIYGNIIGSDVSYTRFIGNLGNGITINNIPSNIIERTSIRGNGNNGIGHGIEIIGSDAAGNIILDNPIGEAISAADNDGHDIFINNAPSNLIQGNSLEGNYWGVGFMVTGVDILRVQGAGAAGNIIQGNNIAGQSSVYPAVTGGDGISIIDAGQNTIGGTSSGEGNSIWGNEVGVLLTGFSLGQVFQGNSVINNDNTGMIIDTNNNQIGGATPGAGNTIRDHEYGITVNSSGNTIQGNIIVENIIRGMGVRYGYGIKLVGNDNTIGGTMATTRNVISGNGKGVIVDGTQNIIQGNFIGTSIDGTAAYDPPFGNFDTGIEVNGSNNTIGGTTGTTPGGPCTGACNVISSNGFNQGHGVELLSSGNVLQGNFIGTDVSGFVALGNRTHGLRITGSGNTIGGASSLARNIISSNGWYIDDENIGNGIYLDGSGASQNVIQGNYIGTDASGTGPLGNRQVGIRINNGWGNTIGGSAVGAGNILAFNESVGVYVRYGGNNRISQNSIFDNEELGIDLDAKGVTLNDYRDGDTGANYQQNFPVVTAVIPIGGTTIIQGMLHSTPSTIFTVEFFSSPTCDPSGFGEGQYYLSSSTLATDSNGDATLAEWLSIVVPAGNFVTATATDPSGNTSEFSPCYYLAPPNVPPTAGANGPYEVDEGETFNLDGSASSDSDGDIELFEWDLDYDGEYDDATGVMPEVFFDDNGNYVVGLIVTDDDGDSDTDSADIIVSNVAPSAVFNRPGSVNEGEDIHLSLSEPFDPSLADITAGFEYAFDCGDGSGYGAWSSDNSVSCQTNNDGNRFVGGKIRDKDGDEREYTATVIVDNSPPLVSIDIFSQTVQYSDDICSVTVTATDVAADNLFASVSPDPLPDGLVLNVGGCEYVAGVKTCTWTIEGSMGVPVGNYNLAVTVTDENGGSADISTSISVVHEDAEIWLDIDNPAAIEVDSADGKSPEFSLKAYVKEVAPDNGSCGAKPGNIRNAKTEMTLAPVGPGSSYTFMCTPEHEFGSGLDSTLEMNCDYQDIDVNTYLVKIIVVGDYYTSIPDEDIFVVFDPSLGFTTGGGWFYWPDTTDKTKFGYVMKYNKKATNIQGSLLLIRHVAPGEKYRIKSNALDGLSLGEAEDPDFGWASFTGKCTYKDRSWLEAEGNHNFLVYVEDRGEPGWEMDRFWIEVYDKDDELVTDMSIERPATVKSITLGGGNIVVPHKGGGGPY